MKVLHSQDRTADLVEMDKGELDGPFEVITDTETYYKVWTSYRCKCHGWVVQEDLRVDLKIGISTLLEHGEIGD